MKREFICKHCGCKFTLTLWKWLKAPHLFDIWRFLKCPECYRRSWMYRCKNK